MAQVKGKALTPPLHRCPVCDHPQTKIQRRVGGATSGSTTYVCVRAECILGRDLSKIETWVPV